MSMIIVRLLLVPTEYQRQKFYEFSYYADRMYNEALQWNIDYYESDGKFYSRFDLINMVTDFKHENPEFDIIDRHVLNIAVTDLRVAFNNMKHGSGFPKFKKYGKKNSFGVRNDSLKVFTNKVQISSIGIVRCKHCHWLIQRMSDEQLAQLQYHNPRIKFDGKYWFLSFGVDVALTPDKTTDEVIGIDLGIKNTIYTSNGISKPNINHTRQVINLERRKKRYQRRVSRKYELNKQGNKFVKTKNIKRLERQIRLIHRRLHNIRENYNQSIANEIIKQFPKRIMLEDLGIKGMMRNRHLAKAIQEQQFYRIRQLLTEKALNTQAVQIGVVQRRFPSSKMCSRCGNIKRNLKLSDRIYVCDSCGLVIDRDYNASLNIRDCKEYDLVAN